MKRRQFLAHGIGFGALALKAGSALADVDTYQAFHSALESNPQLAIFADTPGAQSAQARIEGKLPNDLNGIFFRNGPGRFELGGERYHHWFDGDGFAQRWQIGDGKVSHMGKFVNTQKFDAESRAGKFLYPAFGTFVDRVGIKNNDTLNAANTNLLPLDGRLYALWEGGSATELDPLTLETRGIKTWREDLKAMPFSAHPKSETDGSMWNFGAFPGGDQLALYHLNANGSVAAFAMLPLPQLTMVHDFAISKNHLIFLIAPFDFVYEDGKSFLEMHHWAGSGPNARPMRAVVIDKATLTLRRIFELPPRMVFHFGNAYDDGDTTRFDVVLHEDDVLHRLGKLMRGALGSHTAGHSHATQITLDHATGRAHEARLFGVSEFPRVMPQVVGRRHRMLALLGGTADRADTVLNTVNLVNTDTGKVDGFRFDAGWQVEEHVLVPRRGARSETDGYLLGVAQDMRAQRTVMTVFDASRVSAGPLAMAHLPYRAPHCFHGNFLAAS